MGVTDVPRVCFIVNPAAGHGRALKTWKRIEPLAASLGEYGVKVTERPRHGEDLAREAAREGYDRVVALGGDGTVNEVGNGVVGSGAALGTVPGGSSNDWMRTLGIPWSAEEATRIAFQGRVVKSDVGRIVGGRYFINIAGIGFDAEVTRRVNRYGPVFKMIGGKLPSLLAIAATLYRFGGVDVRADIDGKAQDIERVLLIAVGVAKYYGGGMMILPDAIIDDGLFDIIWGHHLTRMQLIKLVGKTYKGGHVGDPKVTITRGRRITVTSAEPVAYHLDGDVAGDLPVTIEIVPGGLDIIVP